MKQFNTPAKSLRPVRFCALAGVQEADIVGEEVIGTWGTSVSTFYGQPHRLLVEDFVNWSSNNRDILAFVRKYGPVTSVPEAGKGFRFRLALWKTWQKHFRQRWEDFVRSPGPLEFSSVIKSGAIHYRNGHFEFQADTLWNFFYLEFGSTRLESIRKCAAPNCHTPYFIARHLRQKYCSDVCAQWAQKKWKKKWWNERGQIWRRAAQSAVTRSHTRKPNLKRSVHTLPRTEQDTKLVRQHNEKGLRQIGARQKKSR